MRVIALIIENQPVASIGVDAYGIGLRKLLTIDGPVIHPAVASPLLFKHQWHALIWFRNGLSCDVATPKNRVVPGLLGLRFPLRRPALSGIFDDNAEARLACVT